MIKIRHTNCRKTLLVLLLTTTLPSVAFAQDGNPEQDIVDSESVIIITGAGTLALESDALQAVDIIHADELASSYDGSLGATLADLPGISTTNFGPAVGRPVIRGLGGDRVRILTNSVGLVDASTVSTDHALTSEGLEAERVEVLRGAAAIPYGGNAIGGVVNVIDGSIPSSLPDGDVDGRFFLGGTSVDDGHQIAGRLRTALGPLVLQVEGLDRNGDDVSVSGFAKSEALRAIEFADDPLNFDPGPEGTVTNTDFGFQMYGGGASLVGDWGYFGASVRQFDAFYGLPLEEAAEVGIVMEQLRVDVNGEFEVGLGPFHTLTVAGGWVDYQHGENALGALQTLFENDGYEVRASLVNGMPGDEWSGTFGAQYSFSDFSAVGAEDFIPPAETKNFGIFGSQRFDLDAFGFEGGLRYETREINSPVSGNTLSYDALSGSVGAFVRPHDDLFLGATLSRTERAPTNAELFSNGFHPATGTVEIGNANLTKETALSFEGVANYTAPSTTIEASVYYTDFSDFMFLASTGVIDPVADAPVFQYFQDEATFWGFEFKAAQDLIYDGDNRVYADLALEYVRADTDNLGNVPFIPPFSTIVGLNYETENWELRTDLEIVSDAANQAAFELPTDGYVFWGIKGIVRPFGPESLTLILSAENLLNQEARLNTSQLKDLVPLAGRNFRLSAVYEF